MSTSVKPIIIVPYNPDWPYQFEMEANQVKTALGDNCIAIHHIGSTAVPGLAAKPIIDIIGVVENLEKSVSALEQLGYTYKGEYNIPMRSYFSKKISPQIHLHIYEKNHPEIILNLLFRDYLRDSISAREKYAELKIALSADPSTSEKSNSFFSEYTLRKNSFIAQTLRKAKFDSLRLLRCVHYEEWNAYHRIRESTLFTLHNRVYDRKHPSITADNNFHFVLYKGMDIVAAAQVEWLDNQEAALRSLATDKIYQRQGYGSYLLKQIEQWIKYHHRNTIKLHAALSAESFYRNRGYSEVIFNDAPLSEESVDLGKKL